MNFHNFYDNLFWQTDRRFELLPFANHVPFRIDGLLCSNNLSLAGLTVDDDVINKVVYFDIYTCI